MDGVPGISFDGIGRGETYDYRFDVRQGGTYWYHSHSGFQEQAGLYGPLIIDPIAPEPFAYDREHVVMLTDWTDLDPSALFARLKKMPGYDNYYKRTVGDFVRDAKREGVSKALGDRRMWDAMRMTPTDLSDVNANTYTYLMNGATSLANWTGLFRHGEKVRLRFINGSSMTYFDVRIPGLKMTVVAADGQYVHPVTVDEFRIAAAETFDVIVEPTGQDAFTIFAQDMGHTGYVSGTLAVREGLRAPVPALDPRPILTMADMGHGAMSHDMPAWITRRWTTRMPRANASRERNRQSLRRHAGDGADAATRRSGHRPARQRPHGAELRDAAQPVRRSGRARAGPRDRTAPHRPHGALRLGLRRPEVLRSRTACA